MLRRDISPPSSGSENKPSKKSVFIGVLLCLFFDPEFGGNISLEKSVDLQRTTGRHIPEDDHRCEMLRFYNIYVTSASYEFILNV
jgi:hypothetical protein